jgi:membrane dipeptidase
MNDDADRRTGEANTTPIIDAHEDIAWNMLTFDRDYTLGVAEIRRREAGTPIPSWGGSAQLGQDAWLAGRVGVIFATLFASPAAHALGSWDTLAYRNPGEAHRLAAQQLDAYHRLADDHDLFRLIGRRGDLEEVMATWEEDDAADEDRHIGLVPLMEGADPIIEPEQAEEWFERGVRIIGPAWRATRYAGGTYAPGPLTGIGFRLLEVMDDLGMILDLSHLAEEAYFQALGCYEGAVIASHSNPRRFHPDRKRDRGLSDEMIAPLAERDGVIGVMLYNAFLNPDWHESDRKGSVSLLTVADAIDHVCQVTGSAAHVGIGSDLDGGYGWERSPAEVNTVADLRKLVPLLTERGYTPGQIEDILSGNWLRILRRSLPE